MRSDSNQLAGRRCCMRRQDRCGDGRAAFRSAMAMVLLAIIAAAGCGDQDSSVTPDKSQADRVRSDTSPTPTESPAIVTAPLAERFPRDSSQLFDLLSPEQSGVAFKMALPDARKHLKEYMLLSSYGGICTGDYDGDGLADFFVTSPVGGGRLYRNLGGMRFADASSETGIDFPSTFWATGASFADVDNDGRLDLYICSYKSANRLYINKLEGSSTRFVERAEEFGLNYRGASVTMAFADMDNDGDLDGYLATTALPPPPGTKFQVQFKGGRPTVPEHLREYWALIHLPNRQAHRTEAGQYDHLYRNDNGKFVDVSRSSGIDGAHFTLGATWWDFDGDNRPDLYASNDFMGADALYRNNGGGRFVDAIRETMPHTPWFSMGTDVGDVDGDGRIDLIATDMAANTRYRAQVMAGSMKDSEWYLDVAEPRQYMRNALYLNSGAGRMLEVAHLAGVANTNWTWTPRLADFDNDGRVDLFVTTGALRDTMNSDLAIHADQELGQGSAEWTDFWVDQPLYRESNQAYRNQGDVQFTPVAAKWGLDRESTSFGAATADFDNDGDLDLIVNNADAPVSVYRNNSHGSGSLLIELRGTKSNRFGIGATVTIESEERRQVGYVTLARGWMSSCDPTLHFGLGASQRVDRIIVRWPSGTIQEFTDIAANSRCTITEPTIADRDTDSASSLASQPAIFEPTHIFAHVEHTESEFDDYAAQALLPRRMSRLGPAMATADVDDDGRDDIFVGGSRGTTGEVYITSFVQDRYTPVRAKALLSDALPEDIDACFFDCDNDGDRDLYVVSGSNEAPSGDTCYADRLYINQGRGQFTAARAGQLPDICHSGSSVAATDFDLDGDEDLFVGAAAVPGEYPVAEESYLLVNDNGEFRVERPEVLDDLGIVTDALWADVTSDGWLDLVVATQWGPIRVFANDEGELRSLEDLAGLSDHLGWWRSLAAGDIDRDGDVDLIAGNHGLNTPYFASVEQPLVLLRGDFDGSGEPSLIEAQGQEGQLAPLRGLRCLRDAMPLWGKDIATHHDYAVAAMESLFGAERLAAARRWEVNELRSCVLVNAGDGRFDLRPLPRIAQASPANDVRLVDIDGDTHLDLVLAQNDYSFRPQIGRCDGGVCLLLVGDGSGQFQAVWPSESGVVVAGEARNVATPDLNYDGRPDLVFATNNGPIAAYLQTTAGRARPVARVTNRFATSPREDRGVLQDDRSDTPFSSFSSSSTP